MPFFQPLVGQNVLRIILLDEVLNDGTRLPQFHACIRILNRRDAAVGIEVDKWFRLDFLEPDAHNLVWNAEFFENDHDLPRVRARSFGFVVNGTAITSSVIRWVNSRIDQTRIGFIIVDEAGNKLEVDSDEAATQML